MGLNPHDDETMEARESLLEAALNASSTYLAVKRETLILACTEISDPDLADFPSTTTDDPALDDLVGNE